MAKVRSGTLACVHMLAIDDVDSGVTDLKDRELGDEAVLKLNFYEEVGDRVVSIRYVRYLDTSHVLTSDQSLPRHTPPSQTVSTEVKNILINRRAQIRYLCDDFRPRLNRLRALDTLHPV